MVDGRHIISTATDMVECAVGMLEQAGEGINAGRLRSVLGIFKNDKAGAPEQSRRVALNLMSMASAVLDEAGDQLCALASLQLAIDRAQGAPTPRCRADHDPAFIALVDFKQRDDMRCLSEDDR